MTETSSAPDTQAAGPPRLPLNGQDRVLAILSNFASHDMPGRQARIQDCVDEILVKVSGTAAAS